MPVMQAVSVKEVQAVLPATDMERAKRWYRDHLGLEPITERSDGTMYEVGRSHLLLYPSRYAGSNEATAATFVVDDAVQAGAELRRAGVALETFEIPGAEWQDGVAHINDEGGEMYGAWFRDSEGNIVAFAQYEMPGMSV